MKDAISSDEVGVVGVEPSLVLALCRQASIVVETGFLGTQSKSESERAASKTLLGPGRTVHHLLQDPGYRLVLSNGTRPYTVGTETRRSRHRGVRSGRVLC